MTKLKEGNPAPDFSLPSSTGQEIALSDFKNKKKVVLFFYHKDNTPGCTREACDFGGLFKQIEKAGAVILGISKDDLKSHESFIRKFKLPFPLLSDESRAVIKKYGVWKEKSLYGKKYMGVERTTVVIDSKGVVRRLFPKVKVEGHAEEVMKTLVEI